MPGPKITSLMNSVQYTFRKVDYRHLEGTEKKTTHFSAVFYKDCGKVRRKREKFATCLFQLQLFMWRLLGVAPWSVSRCDTFLAYHKPTHSVHEGLIMFSSQETSLLLSQDLLEAPK